MAFSGARQVRRSFFWLATAAALLLPAAAGACDGGATLMDDGFHTFSPAWGFALDPPSETIDGNGLSFAFGANRYRRGISQLSYYDDYVACATFRVTFTCTDAKQCETQPYVGLIVLGNDNRNFYTFEVSPATASFSLSRLQNNKWLYPVGWTPLPAGISVASGDLLELQATVKGSTMSFEVNGKDVLTFDGTAPEGGSLVGFEVGTHATDTAVSKISLSKVTVRSLP